MKNISAYLTLVSFLLLLGFAGALEQGAPIGPSVVKMSIALTALMFFGWRATRKEGQA